MAKFELTKNIEAKKLNKRTGVPTGGPPVNIPYGALIDDPSEDRDLVNFSYLGEPYQCSRDTLHSAATPISGVPAEWEGSGSSLPSGKVIFCMPRIILPIPKPMAIP